MSKIVHGRLTATYANVLLSHLIEEKVEWRFTLAFSKDLSPMLYITRYVLLISTGARMRKTSETREHGTTESQERLLSRGL